MQTLRGVRALRRRSLSDITDMSGVLNEIAKAQVENALSRVACFVSMREAWLCWVPVE